MAIHGRIEAADGQPFQATWLVSAPWAHPLWHSYAFLLYDLTTPLEKPSFKKREDVTHEMLVYAMHPDRKPHVASDMKDWNLDGCCLRPANHGYQFAAPSHEAAHTRIAALVEMIEGQRLSPDTDFRRDWDSLFADAETLLVNG